MGITERKERQKAELREQILTAAREIVVRDGLEGLTIRKLADAIEYAPGTIYLHFAGRDKIACALIEDSFFDLLRYLTPAAQIADPLERLEAMGRAYIGFALERPETYRLIFMQPPELASALRQLVKHEGDEHVAGDRAFSVLEGTVRELIDSGRFMPGDPVLIADAIWTWMHGLVSLVLTCPEMLSESSKLVDTIVNGALRAFATA